MTVDLGELVPVGERYTILEGDCVERMAEMAESSIDAVVCDPPYGLEFMGKEWDSFRVDARSARWASRSGEAGGFGERDGVTLPNYGRRRTTSRCKTCGKRDAFRNPHDCGDAAEWQIEYVDVVPVEMRAFQNWCHGWALEAYRVLKPGGHLLAFGGTRTYHRLACAVEDAGFEVRDTIAWMYGQGFPKSMDVSKAIDKRAGAEREVVDQGENWGAAKAEDGKVAIGDYAGRWDVTAPATEDAAHWEGWGTALKPAFEPIVVARKPMVGTTVANVLEHGTGALNIDATRIEVAGGSPSVDRREAHAKRGPGVHPRPTRETPFAAGVDPEVATDHFTAPRAGEQIGRWPPNVALGHSPDCKGSTWQGTDVLCVDGCPVKEMNEQTAGISAAWHAGPEGDDYDASSYKHPAQPGRLPPHIDGLAGHGARFFYIAKAKSRERVAGVERNLHPTVKPVQLMRWLVRLVTPPGGVILDPFLGSGSTGCAAMAERFRFVGIERDPDYLELARARVADWAFAHPPPKEEDA